MTLAMRCGLPISSAVSSTSCAAVAVCRAIEKISGINCGIKWVNDIFIGSGKLAGILVESVNDYSKMTSEYLIIGVGVNIESSPQIVDSSYGTTCLLEHGVSISADSLCHEIVRQFIEIRKNNFDFSKYLDEYTSRSIVIGKSVSFIHNGKELTGTAVGINSCGGLILNSNNRVITLDSGEISIKLRP